MILFFSPYSHPMKQRVSQYQVARAIKKESREILWFVDDTGDISRHSGKNFVLFEKIASKVFGFKPIFTSTSINSSNRIEIIEKYSEKITTLSKFLLLKHKGIEIGKICASFYLYLEKRLELKQSDLSNIKLRNIIYDTLISIEIASTVLAKSSIQHVISYNGGYPPHRVFLQIARNNGLNIISLEGGINLSQFHSILRFCPGFDMEEWAYFHKLWPTIKDLPLDTKHISESRDHLLAVLRQESTHCYSLKSGNWNSDSLNEKFNCHAYEKVVLVATSSEDELKAASICGVSHISDGLFIDQIEWVSEIIDYAKENTNILFIIRIHPREFENHESVMASRFLQLLHNSPENVKVNLPEDNISAHDFIHVTDLLLVALSNLATEFLMLGIPVLRYCRTIGYPDDHGFLSNNSVKVYFEDLLNLCSASLSFEDIRYAYRFNAINRSASRIRLIQSGFISIIQCHILRFLYLISVGLKRRKLIYIIKSLLLIHERKPEKGIVTVPLEENFILKKRYSKLKNNDYMIENERKAISESISETQGILGFRHL
tara:strand:+ start:3687 stop:5324 length:1638 start_codon:yes stop_codon:yes gene_type:complete